MSARERLAPLMAVALAAGCAGNTPAQPGMPLADGHYVFLQRFAEQPSIDGARFEVNIAGLHIKVVNHHPTRLFPAGLINAGQLMWSRPTHQWIIGQHPADAQRTDVGGCSGGPTVVDLAEKIYWTC